MKKGEKIFLLVLISITAIVIILSVMSKRNNNQATVPNDNVAVENTVKEEFVQNLEDGTKLNVSSELNKDKMVGELLFQNIQLTNRNGQTVLLADVTNTGSSTSEMQLVDVLIFDKNGTQLGQVGGIIGKIEPGAHSQFNTSMMMDYANAYDFKVQAKQ